MTRDEIFARLYSTAEVYPPPLEQHSALLEVTIGCSYRKCRFCDFPRDNFKIFSLSDIAKKIELLRLVIDGNPKLHLLGCNPFCLHFKQLMAILEMVRNLLPCVQEVSMYARADDVLRKSDEELKALARMGLFALHIGLESGSNSVLELHHKGETTEDIENALNALDRCGIHYHLTAIPGLGGKEFSREHAVKTAALISRHTPMRVWCIGLKVWPNTPLQQMVISGEFSPLTWEEILREERTVIANVNPKLPCLYVDSTVLGKYTIAAMLPDQRKPVLQQIDQLLAGENSTQSRS
jgi:radical SAM superfamily enzyme YgiQ (UPF0313 family)